jgi:hypothetical protein
MKVPTNIFKGAIQRLQERLGEIEGKRVTHQEMVRRIGCSDGGYKKWVEGKAIPRGDWMLKIIALCPDDDCRELFWQALKHPIPTPKAATGGVAMPVTRNQSVQEMIQNNSRVIQELEDRAATGDRSAAEALRVMAETMGRAAHIATRPDREQRRKANLNIDGINHHRDT